MTTSIERREKHRADMRTRILDAARELIVAEGVDSFSMRKLAGKIGYTATAIYFHFADKETLLQELVDLDFAHFRGQFDASRATPDPIARIMLMGRAFVGFFVDHPGHFRFLFMTPNLKIEPSAKVVEKGNPAEDNYCLLKSTVEEAMAKGLFRDDLTDAHELCQIFMGTVHGVVANHICREAHPWIEFRPVHRTAEVAMEAVMRGLLKKPDTKSGKKT